jgi:nickel-dependent lactate racemase
MEIKLPFDDGFLNAVIPDERLAGVMAPHPASTESPRQEYLAQKALEEPISSLRLRELAAGKNKILLITSDHTRPVPSRITMPLILDEIRAGAPGAEIKILIATGLHRPMSKDEIVQRFGSEIAEREEIINHDARDDENLVFKGILPSGGELWLNSLVDWADLTAAEGFIEPHFFAGYSGGRKSVLPGIASEKTVRANHCSKFIASPLAAAGSLDGNPIHLDMLYAAKEANLAFILNVALDPQKRIIAAFAGHPEKAHEQGAEFMEGLASVDAVPADIVATTNGGYPLDQNIYQAVKGMTAAEACVKPGGVIIMAAGCRDGHGGEMFYRFFKEAASQEELLKSFLAVKQEDTPPDQWEAQILARILAKNKVVFISKENVRGIIEDMFMSWAPDFESALAKASAVAGAESLVSVIPDGVSVIVN